MFTNQILCDGYSCHFQFARPAKGTPTELELEDFESAGIDNYYRVCAIDPGVKNLFTASYGEGEESHEIRRCTGKEYYHMTGSPQRNKQLLRKKKQAGIDKIETEFPTAKTADIEVYHRHVEYFFLHKDSIFTFYNAEDAERRFRNYQGKQRAQEELANMLINGGRKYNKKKRKHRNKNRKCRKRQRQRKRKKSWRYGMNIVQVERWEY